MSFEMKTRLFLVFLGIIFSSTSGFSQDEINQMDANGKRHGRWLKHFPDSEQIRYEGTFQHGKEVGEFKFYCEDCKSQPNAVLTYNENDNIAQVQYFDKKGKLLSEGWMKDQNRTGEWVYYHKTSSQIMSRENYSNGLLEGRTTTYYPNGNKTEETEYKNGIKEGQNNYYSPEGILLKKLLYKNDELHGPAVYYDGYGKVILEGSYKDGKKHGLWKEYKDGKLVSEEVFPKKYDKKKGQGNN